MEGRRKLHGGARFFLGCSVAAGEVVLQGSELPLEMVVSMICDREVELL